MISDIIAFSFITESLGNAFVGLISRADGHHVGHICIRQASGFQVVDVATNSRIDCVFNAVFVIDDDPMSASVRPPRAVEHAPM